MKIEEFEELECWQQARILTNMVYELTKQKTFSQDYRLKDQIVGSAISVMNNIAEGFASQSNREFIRFLTYSRRSVSEIQTCLYVALDQNYISKEQFSQVYVQAQKTRQIVDGFIRYLRTQRTKRK